MARVCRSGTSSCSSAPTRTPIGSMTRSRATSTASSSRATRWAPSGCSKRALRASTRSATSAPARSSASRQRSAKAPWWCPSCTSASGLRCRGGWNRTPSRPCRLPASRSDCALGRARHRGGVLGHHSTLVAGLWRFVRLHPLRDLLVGEVDVEPAGVDVDRDLVAVPDRGDRATADRLWSHVPGHQAVGGPREAGVREQRDLIAGPLAAQRSGDLEHLAHPRPARGTLVADHHYVAGPDPLLFDHCEALLLGGEDPGRARVFAALLAGDLAHAALGRQLAAKDHQAARGLERIRERANDLLAGRLLGRVRLLADRGAGDRDALAVKHAGLVEPL